MQSVATGKMISQLYVFEKLEGQLTSIGKLAMQSVAIVKIISQLSVMANLERQPISFFWKAGCNQRQLER